MKARKVLSVLCILFLTGAVIFGLGNSYAQSQIDKRAGKEVGETTAASEVVEALPEAGNVDPNGKGPDKGSPMHAWKAIVASGKEAGDAITSAEFAGMRNWSARTRGYELQSLVAIGVLAPTGNRGEYKLLVGATDAQIDQVNEKAKTVVERNLRGEALGIDSYRLDAAYLGKGDTVAGNTKLNQIAGIIQDVTGVAATAQTANAADFVEQDVRSILAGDASALPASIAIEGEMPFTINGKDLVGTGISAGNIKDKGALLAALVDTRIVSPEAALKNNVSDFNSTDIKTVMFKEEFVTGQPGQFKAAFEAMSSDQTAVIIAINKNNGEIRQALEQAGLLGQWGNRIIVMGVKPNSPAADAFGRLFGDKSMYSLRGEKIEDILKNKDLIAGLEGAV